MSETINLTGIDYACTPHDGGARATIHCWTSPAPNVDDYLLIPNGESLARYKVTESRLDMNVQPNAMWTAQARHAPSTNP